MHRGPTVLVPQVDGLAHDGIRAVLGNLRTATSLGETDMCVWNFRAFSLSLITEDPDSTGGLTIVQKLQRKRTVLKSPENIPSRQPGSNPVLPTDRGAQVGSEPLQWG